ncbi:calcium-binding protein, partial [Yoonia sp. I 8.24]|uniref:calcium-binding protein n=1 Tax=Yoonia sp. I 8.24 TaxID=1537229 RepID=UPI001F8B8D56|nr:hypothetical protein [Yoonia sp. I 8.24]
LFSDGTLDSNAAVVARAVLDQGTDGDDTIVGTGHGDIVDGGLGNDTITAGDGDDTIIYSGGDDVIAGNLENFG